MTKFHELPEQPSYIATPDVAQSCCIQSQGDKVHRILFFILEMSTPYPRVHFIDLEKWTGIFVS